MRYRINSLPFDNFITLKNQKKLRPQILIDAVVSRCYIFLDLLLCLYGSQINITSSYRLQSLHPSNSKVKMNPYFVDGTSSLWWCHYLLSGAFPRATVSTKNITPAENYSACMDLYFLPIMHFPDLYATPVKCRLFIHLT